MQIRGPFVRERLSVRFDDPSLTQQQFKNETDVNYILKHFQEAPRLTAPGSSAPRAPMWGAFDELPDLKEAHALLQQAGDDFMTLPSDVRSRFGNNPLELLAFVSDAKNREEAVKLGLIEKSKPVPQVIAPVDGVAAVNGETVKEM